MELAKFGDLCQVIHFCFKGVCGFTNLHYGFMRQSLLYRLAFLEAQSHQTLVLLPEQMAKSIYPTYLIFQLLLPGIQQQIGDSPDTQNLPILS